MHEGELKQDGVLECGFWVMPTSVAGAVAYHYNNVSCSNILASRVSK